MVKAGKEVVSSRYVHNIELNNLHLTVIRLETIVFDLPTFECMKSGCNNICRRTYGEEHRTVIDFRRC